jgi:phenylpropionate dioxygenase-like ring-hydroxylating dioxygenase large terminal subunit
MPRFPFATPNGWFQVLYSDELAAGEVKRLRYLGRELVAFRGESGAAHVLDAHCPHLGAHLGEGGRVEGDTIRCPFHGWRWDGSGSCAEIPYARRIPPRAVARSYPVREIDDRVYLWHHAEAKEPDWEIPKLPEYGTPDWTTRWVRYRWTVRTQPQEIMENAIDWPHFAHVHAMAAPDDRSESFDGPVFHWRIDTRYENSPVVGPSTDLSLRAYNWGLGYCANYYTGAFATLSVTALTPVDGETTEMFHGVIGRLDGRDADRAMAELAAQMEEQAEVVKQDFAIWEHKCYRARPVLCEGDGPIAAFRSWAQQFYGVPGSP